MRWDAKDEVNVNERKGDSCDCGLILASQVLVSLPRFRICLSHSPWDSDASCYSVLRYAHILCLPSARKVCIDSTGLKIDDPLPSRQSTLFGPFPLGSYQSDGKYQWLTMLTCNISPCCRCWQ